MARSFTEEELIEIGKPCRGRKSEAQVKSIEALENASVRAKVHDALVDCIYDLPENFVKTYLSKPLAKRGTVFEFMLEELNKGNLELLDGLVEEKDLPLTMDSLMEIVNESMRGTLESYQTYGVAYMLASQKCLLGDECGLGKTVEVCGTLARLQAKNKLNGFIIVCESGAALQWQREIVRFTGLNVVVVDTSQEKIEALFSGELYTDEELEKVDGFIFKHSILSQPYSVALFSQIPKAFGFNTFVLDESSVIKASKTKAFESVNTMMMQSDLEYVYLLNATAFEMVIEDLYNQFVVIDPSLFRSRNWVEERFCQMKLQKIYYRGGGGKCRQKRVIVGYKNTEQFKSRVKYFYLARTRESIGITNHNTCACRLFQKTSEMNIGIRANDGMWNEVLNCPTLCDNNKAYYKVKPGEPSFELRMNENEMPKLAGLFDLVEQKLIDGKRHLVVYCWHKDSCEYLCKEFTRRFGEDYKIKADILNGNTQQSRKQDKLDEFNDGSINILVTNVAKSVNLSVGEVCIFYSVVTNPAKLLQIASRINRDTSGREREYYVLAYRGEEAAGIVNAYKRLLYRKKLLGEVNDASSDILGVCFNEIRRDA